MAKVQIGRPGAKAMNEFIRATQKAAVIQAQAVQKAINKAGAKGLTVIVPKAPKGR